MLFDMEDNMGVQLDFEKWNNMFSYIELFYKRKSMHSTLGI